MRISQLPLPSVETLALTQIPRAPRMVASIYVAKSHGVEHNVVIATRADAPAIEKSKGAAEVTRATVRPGRKHV